MRALYNEIEPYAADWLESLARQGSITAGRVERRSIKDLKPEDLRDATQCHFFAGIGVWSRALRDAGWSDDREVWTGSCPCQPFSQAGHGSGFDDARHLWPVWFALIRECRPAVVLGEQVASPAGLVWLDAVQDDLEGEGYAVGAVDLAAASVGAPHIRQRLYFCAIRADVLDHSGGGGGGGRYGRAVPREEGEGACERGGVGRLPDVARAAGAACTVDDDDDARCEGCVPVSRGWDGSTCAGGADGLPDDDDEGRREQRRAELLDGERTALGDDADGRSAHGGVGNAELHDGSGWIAEPHGRASLEPDRPSPTNGFWSPCDWIPCSDGKLRPVEPGTQPLAHGAPTRVVASGAVEAQPRTRALHGYGNAIVRPLAAEFVRTVMDVLGMPTKEAV